MLFGDLCKKYDVNCKGPFRYEKIPDEWGANDVSYEFDDDTHIWRRDKEYESITFDGSNYTYHVEFPDDSPVFEKFISEEYGSYIT